MAKQRIVPQYILRNSRITRKVKCRAFRPGTTHIVVVTTVETVSDVLKELAKDYDVVMWEGAMLSHHENEEVKVYDADTKERIV
jgi:hypothetical protein